MKTPTLRALADRADRPDELVAAGEVLDLRFGGEKGEKAMSLRAGKLLHLLVQAAGADACNDKIHSIPIASLNSTFHLTLEDFVITCRELFRTTVRLEVNVKGKRAVKVGPLLSDVERDLDEGDGSEVRFQLSPVLRLVLARSNHWAALSRTAVLAFESRYALRLYEILALRKGLDHKREETFTIDDLRARLGVPKGKLTRWQDIKRYALEPAVAEVNQLSGLTVSYEAVKKGRAVAAVRIRWRERDPHGRAAAARELEGSRVGRRTRREGTAETVLDGPQRAAEALPAPSGGEASPQASQRPPGGFPEAGSIRWSPWAQIARSALPEPMPDIDGVADRFRRWTTEKGISLDAPGVEKSFRGFCKREKPA